MHEQNIEKLDALIKLSPDVDFAPKKNWASGDLIEAAEADLGFKLPESYKWWLNHYKAGSIGFDQEIYSIYRKTSGVATYSDIVASHLRKNKHPSLPDNALVFFTIHDGDELYYFDVNPENSEYEIHIYSVFDGQTQFYANNFIEFLIKFIELNTTQETPRKVAEEKPTVSSVNRVPIISRVLVLLVVCIVVVLHYINL